MTESENRRNKILELLYRYQPMEMVPIGKYLARGPGGREPDEAAKDRWLRTLGELRRDGLVTLSETFVRGLAGISALLTEEGRAEVEERHARWDAEAQARERRRSDPALRRTAAVNGLLRWLYEQDPDGVQWLQVDQFLASERSLFEGGRLPENVVRRAAQYLQDNELIRGDSGVADIDGPLTAQITANGQDCVESGGDVADYLRQKIDRATNITNFHGTVSGNVTWDSTQVTQTATTTGLAGDEVGVLVRAITEAIPVLGLPDKQAAAVRDNVEVIEGELAQPEPDRHIVKTMMRRTLDVLAGTANSALGLILTGYAKELMKSAGLPIE